MCSACRYCHDAIQTIINANPELLNFQDENGHTPLHTYFTDPIYHPNWSFELFEELMTEENINLQGKAGNTALHFYFYQEQRGSEVRDSAVLKAALEVGADLMIVNDDGQTVSDLLVKAGISP